MTSAFSDGFPASVLKIPSLIQEMGFLLPPGGTFEGFQFVDDSCPVVFILSLGQRGQEVTLSWITGESLAIKVG